MGVWIEDPDIEWNDIYWYDTFVAYGLRENEELISVHKDLNMKSFYVELHRNGE